MVLSQQTRAHMKWYADTQLLLKQIRTISILQQCVNMLSMSLKKPTEIGQENKGSSSDLDILSVRGFQQGFGSARIG